MQFRTSPLRSEVIGAAGMESLWTPHQSQRHEEQDLDHGNLNPQATAFACFPF